MLSPHCEIALLKGLHIYRPLDAHMVDLNTLLDQLENAQLVRRAPGDDQALLLKHAVTQETAYESLLYKTRPQRFVALRMSAE